MTNAQKSRNELAERMLNSVLTISIANPMAELLTEVMVDDMNWWVGFVDAIQNAEPEARTFVAQQCFANTLREAQRRAASSK